MKEYFFKLKSLEKGGGYHFITIEADSPSEAETILLRHLLDKGIADRRLIVGFFEIKWDDLKK